MNLVRGKEIFTRCKGNRTVMAQEGLLEEYILCKVPKRIEAGWAEDYVGALKSACLLSSGDKHVALACACLPLLSEDDACTFLLQLCERDIDTFGLILLYEQLRRYHTEHHKKISTPLSARVATTLLRAKQKLLAKPITVDESYKEIPAMKDYDFSEENLRKRINLL